MAPHLLLRRVPLRRALPQARPDDRRPGLGHRPPRRPGHDPARHAPPIPEVLIEFVLWLWWCVTLGLAINARRPAPAVSGRPSRAAPPRAGHPARQAVEQALRRRAGQSAAEPPPHHPLAHARPSRACPVRRPSSRPRPRCTRGRASATSAGRARHACGPARDGRSSAGDCWPRRRPADEGARLRSGGGRLPADAASLRRSGSGPRTAEWVGLAPEQAAATGPRWPTSSARSTRSPWPCPERRLVPRPGRVSSCPMRSRIATTCGSRSRARSPR